MANITLMGASYSDVPAVNLPKTGGGMATFLEVAGSQTFTENGTFDVSTLAQAIVNVGAEAGWCMKPGRGRPRTTSRGAR